MELAAVQLAAGGALEGIGMTRPETRIVRAHELTVGQRIVFGETEIRLIAAVEQDGSFVSASGVTPYGYPFRSFWPRSSRVAVAVADDEDAA